MQDRVPLYPGRVTLTPVSEQANTYDMTRADQPTQEGTPLNKANLFSDETAAKYPAGTETVDGALAALPNMISSIGDTKTTLRTDLGPTWLLCNGDEIDGVEYPELAAMYKLNPYSTLIPIKLPSTFSFTKFYIKRSKKVNDYYVILGEYSNPVTGADGATTEEKGGVILYTTDPTGTWSVNTLPGSYTQNTTNGRAQPLDIGYDVTRSEYVVVGCALSTTENHSYARWTGSSIENLTIQNTMSYYSYDRELGNIIESPEGLFFIKRYKQSSSRFNLWICKNDATTEGTTVGTICEDAGHSNYTIMDWFYTNGSFYYCVYYTYDYAKKLTIWHSATGATDSWTTVTTYNNDNSEQSHSVSSVTHNKEKLYIVTYYNTSSSGEWGNNTILVYDLETQKAVQSIPITAADGSSDIIDANDIYLTYGTGVAPVNYPTALSYPMVKTSMTTSFKGNVIQDGRLWLCGDIVAAVTKPHVYGDNYPAEQESLSISVSKELPSIGFSAQGYTYIKAKE